jgi:hypothetical protein
MSALVSASLLMSLAGFANAEGTLGETLQSHAFFASGAGDSLLPKRWCIETHRAAPSLAELLESTQLRELRWSGQYAAYDYRLGEAFADRSALSYRLAELERDRLVTFWRGDSVGVFLGITRGGFLSLSIAR